MEKKYIDAEKLRKKIVEQLESLPREVGRGAGTITSKGYGMMEAFQIVRSIIDSLQQKQTDIGEFSDGYHTFNELYYYRMLYNAAFFNLLPKEWVHKSKRHHTGEECFGGGWFIVMANLPTGQISNHYELKDWDLFQIPEKEIADEWDGHTPQEAAERLHKYLTLQEPEVWTEEDECKFSQICDAIDEKYNLNYAPQLHHWLYQKIEISKHHLQEPAPKPYDEDYLNGKIAKASESWKGVDVDKFMDEVRGREPKDLEEAANEYSEKHGFRVPYDGSNNFYDEVDVKASKEGFIAGAKWLESQMPMPEDTVIFIKGVAEGRRLEREDRNDDNLPRFYGD